MILREDVALELNNEILGILEEVIMSRPRPKREYDQIYMKAQDMFWQAMFVSRFLLERRVVFLGDGDAMSLLLLLLMNNKNIPSAKKISVLDFDERIVNNYKEKFRLYENRNKIELSAEMYNVINPLDSKNIEAYDFFYINPPYGSKNAGRSCMAWLYRCMELCTDKCGGCIILPYESKLEWTVKNIKNIEQFLLSNGFVIRDIISDIHQYHLPDNPELKSSTIIVERVEKVKSKYANQMLPEEMVRNFYGRSRKLPEYVRDDGSVYGVEDYSWKYGESVF